jgi:hypothetical protein
MIFELVLICVVLLLFAAYLTNPFSKYSIIKRPYTTKMAGDVVEAINNNHKLIVRQNIFHKTYAKLACGLYILHTRYVKSPRSSSTNVQDIITDIHELRYDPKKLLLISGDHFSALFVRNLGVFYYPMLDTAIPSSSSDWERRQAVYLQTLAYALGVFHKSPQLTTTIVSTGPYAATCVNFYAYPSDTLYGMLYALSALLGGEKARPYAYTSAKHKLHTPKAAQLLLDEYQVTLQTLYADYRKIAFDDDKMLVKKSVHMSGAKDITRRESAFYDNVIFWKTTQLAMNLGLIEADTVFLRKLKTNILKVFWLAEEGYFLEDLSDEGVDKKYYSSDWLIVLATGFLDPAKRAERQYYERSTKYIQDQGIARPFAIKYQNERRAHRQFLVVRLAVASYGGNSIWSFWGMEYIKVLFSLYRETGDEVYAKEARFHVQKYKEAMVRDGGFPEVYDANGAMLKTPFYRSIRQTGWVIGFEQVQQIYDSIVGAKPKA